MVNDKRRFQELDALRGLAALSVVIFHYTTRYDELFGHEKIDSLSFSYGHLGVDLFFMISGFVIFMTVTKINNVGEFAKKRAVRLFPAYLVAVFITFIAVKIYGLEGRGVSYFEGIFNLTMLQGFIPGIKHVDGAYWSLTFELIFYFLIGLVIFSGLKNHIFKILITWLSVSFIFQAFSFITDGHFISGAITFYSAASYAHLFVAGTMFYLLRERFEIKYLIVLVGCLINQFVFNDWIPSLISTSFFIIFYLVINDKLKILNIRPLTYLGAISYSWYLVHQNLGYIAINIMEKYGLIHEIYLLIPLGVSILLATFLTYYIEMPIIKFFNNKMKRNLKIKEETSRILT